MVRLTKAQSLLGTRFKEKPLRHLLAVDGRLTFGPDQQVIEVHKVHPRRMVQTGRHHPLAVRHRPGHAPEWDVGRVSSFLPVSNKDGKGWECPFISVCGKEGGGTCGLSTRCTGRIGTADRRSVTETTMRTGEVAVAQPGLKVLVALLGVGPVARVSPLFQSGLDEAFGLAVSARSVGAGGAVVAPLAALKAGSAVSVGRSRLEATMQQL